MLYQVRWLDRFRDTVKLFVSPGAILQVYKLRIDQLKLILMVSKVVYYVIVGSVEILHLGLYEVYALVMLLYRAR